MCRLPLDAFPLAVATMSLRVAQCWCALLLTLPMTAWAQEGESVVRGSVRDSAARPVQGVRIAVVGLERATETDASGAFVLRALPQARLRISARRLGFSPETLSVDLTGPDPGAVELRLGRALDQLPPVVVNARADVDPRMLGFYQRAREGRGRYFTAADIERRGYTRMTDVLRSVPGLMTVPRPTSPRTGARMRATRQPPLVWLDGTPLGSGEFDLDAFDPRAYAGVEIYPGPATVPMEFAGNSLMSSAGGAIILWTKRGQLTTRARRQPRSASARLVRDLVASGEAFGPADVDESVQQVLLEMTPLPEYPDSLLQHGIGGSVLVEFVVDSTGRVRRDSFGVIATTHALLVDPVRAAVATYRYLPAQRAGRPVAQVVMLPFQFLPDSTVRLTQARTPR